MLRSRRAFLEAGHFQPLLEELIRRVRAASPDRVVDVGCGEGYFAGAIGRALPEAEVWGIDVSRAGLDMAASRHAEASFAVATARDLPFLDGSVDVLLSVFGPVDFGEDRRVLTAQGRLIVVGPGAGHLLELRQTLFHEVRSPGRRVALDPGAGWAFVDHAELRYAARLDPDDRANLLAMTPYAWSGGDDSRRAILYLRGVGVHFVIDEWVRTH